MTRVTNHIVSVDKNSPLLRVLHEKSRQDEPNGSLPFGFKGLMEIYNTTAPYE
jgi:hypothetical protein